MKMTQLIVVSMVLAGLSLLGSISANSAPAANWQTVGGGDWDNPANWNTGNVPDTATEAAGFPWMNGGPQIVSVNDTMYPGGLTTGSLISSGTYPQLHRATIIHATGSGSFSPLDWTLGDAANAASINIRYHQLFLTNTNLDFLGTSTGNFIQLTRAVHGWSIDATNSSIDMTPAPAKGLAVTDGGSMRMTGGDLNITNGTNDAQITIAGTYSSLPPAHLLLDGTTFSTNQINLSSEGAFTFDGLGASPATVSGRLTVSSGGTANLNSGTISFGSILLDSNTAATPSNVDVNGATVNVAGGVLLKTSSTSTSPDQLNITAGSLTTSSLEASGSSAAKGAYEVNVSGTGSLLVNGELQLGWDDTPGRHGAGTLIISGGSVTANSLVVGADRGSDANSRGYYEQTGGVAEFGSIELSRDQSTTHNYGTREFVVGPNGVLRIVGAGFSQTGQGDWLVDDTPGLLDFSGTVVFDPSVLTSQTLLAFGKELPTEVYTSVTDITDDILGNYGIGTLDLTGLNGSEVLHVLPAYNETNNALYIDALLGLTDTEATTHLDSALNIYYNASNSPLLRGKTLLLNSGGSLIALVSVPEPSSLLLVSLGAWIGITRRRKKRNKDI